MSDFSKGLPTDTNLLVVFLQESEATTQTFMNRGGYEFGVVYDKDGTSAASYKVSFLPKYYLIDESGKLVKIFSGVFTKDELTQKITSM